jgi:YHS domain-containing protein
VEVFVQDPEAYLERLGVTLIDPVHRDRDARLEASLRARVNHETWFFSDAGSRDEFLRRPLRYVGRVTDPIRGTRFAPDEATPVLEFHGRSYFFEDPSTLSAFRGDPERFAEPRRAMR